MRLIALSGLFFILLAAPAAAAENLWSLLFVKGGVVTWVIALMSAIGVPILGFKLAQFWRAGLWRAERLTPALAALRADNVDGFNAALAATRHPAAPLLHFAAREASRARLSSAILREELERRAQALLRRLRGHVWVMELIATTAPLLGLLGTVLGMIIAFQGVEQGAQGGHNAGLATGIWEALLTTAFGLVVAVPFSLAASIFTNAIERVQDEMEDALTDIMVRAAMAGKGA